MEVIIKNKTQYEKAFDRIDELFYSTNRSEKPKEVIIIEAAIKEYEENEFNKALSKIKITTPKVKPKIKNGFQYIVVDDLPEDQKKAWLSGLGVVSCITSMSFEGKKFTPYYHDYESRYEQWVHGTPIILD